MFEYCANTNKEVYYHIYCNKCKYNNCPESDEPCSTCLNQPVNEFSHKPIKFKEKK